MQKDQKNQKVRLTEFSHGAGCGCKLSPSVLSSILKGQNQPPSGNLLVGNDEKDDAAVYKLDENNAIISTTDFFMPIVDDPFDFGRIAAANAISDVYAMGGKPIMAISILGWPISKLAPEIAGEVIKGARNICKEAGITLAGGHSIDSPEPIFGLAVTGHIHPENVKRNNTVNIGDLLFLTKPLGIGILTTAEKNKVLKEEHKNLARDQMVKINSIGLALGQKEYINAMTDVTGFGLAGHLVEMCSAGNVSAEINLEKIPLIEDLKYYISKACIPGGTTRNWESYGDKLAHSLLAHKEILADPQTSGGLLLAINPEYKSEFLKLAHANKLNYDFIGSFTKRKDKVINLITT